MFSSPDRRCSKLFLAGLSAALAATSLTGCANSTTQDPVDDKVPHTATDPLPLDPYRVIADQTQGYDAEKAYADHQRFQEVIRGCMKEQGFEYFPAPSTLEDFQTPGRHVPDEPASWAGGLVPGTLEYAERYGFGIVESLSQPLGPDPEKGEVPPDEAAYWDSLSESDIEAHYIALHGRDNGMTPDADGIFTWHWTKAGCEGKAVHKVYGEVTYPEDDPDFADLVSALWDNEPNMDNDDAYAALQGDWSDCMEKAGYQFPDRPGAALALWDEKPGSLDGDGPPEPSPEIDAFHQREIAAAVTDATCAQQIDYDQRLLDLTHAFEQRFVEEHRKELDALTLKYGS